MSEGQSVKNVIAACNELLDGKVLYIDRSIQKLLEAIAGSDEVYALIADCLSLYNKDKEFEKTFTIAPNGFGTFNMPKEEVKIIALVFCLLADIKEGKINLDDLLSKYFLTADGRKDYRLFMQKTVIPFRDLIAEAFGVSSNVTTVEAIENMEECDAEDECFEEHDEEDEEFVLGKPKFKFREGVNLEKTFELVSDVSEQIYSLLEEERKQTEEVRDGMDIINSIVIACQKEDFEMVYSLVIGLRYALRSIKDVRFLVRELVDIVKSRLY